MALYDIFTILLTLAVAIGYINHRFVKIQPTIAITSGALLISLCLIFLRQLGFTHSEEHAARMLMAIDFNKLLLNGMLSFLLFAGSLTVDLNSLKAYKWEIGLLSSVSTVLSAILVTFATYALTHCLGVHLPLLYCALFGALISPTDPIAVLATLRELKAPKPLTTIMAGESLFNDGVGIVIFLTLYQLTFALHAPTWESTTLLFLQEAVGGIVYGFLLGYIGYHLISRADDHKLEILITLVLVAGGYLLAEKLNVSGPLAMVVSGILLGNHKSDFFMKAESRQHLETFWGCIDEILNAVLFLLIGLELLVLHLSDFDILLAALCIPLVLLVRFLTVAAPFAFFQRRKHQHGRGIVKILTWGGLRGGLAVAMALALPDNHFRSIVLAMTYAVVLFAVVVQGLTAKRLLRAYSL